ncbi:MAG: LapA family protein [Bosea sp. (in: a-proteobacteria)]
MRALLKALVLVPVALVIVMFCIANRQVVRVSLDPLSRDAPLLSYDLPLFAIVLGALAVGILIGGTASWLAQGKYRKAARINRREAERLRGETETLRAALPNAALPAVTAG